MKDRCSTCVKFHFTRKLTEKKLFPFAIENLNPPLHLKTAPEPLFVHQVLHSDSLTWRKMSHSETVHVIGLELPYSVLAEKWKITDCKKRHDDELQCKQHLSELCDSRVGSRAVTKNIHDALSESRHRCDFKDVGEWQQKWVLSEVA